MSKKNRMIKKPDELLAIMEAQAMGDACFTHMLEYIRPGMSEIQIAEEIERTLMALGAEAIAFDTICVSGENGDQPHGVPSERLIRNWDLLTMDFGAVVRGFCGDMTRTIAIGDLSEEKRQAYDIVLKAQEAGLAACRAGVPCVEVDKACRDIITEAGFGEYFVHGTGHGVGREVHEDPTLNAKSDEILKAYMPVTVEPGIYVPGSYGIRIEDLAIITEFGIINATKSRKDLIII